MPDKNNKPVQPQTGPFSPADSGNASNPSPIDKNTEPEGNDQLLDDRAEKYIREVASMEDYPDPQDEQDMDNIIKETNKDTNE